MSDFVPRWNLDDIFPSADGPEYKKAVDDFLAGIRSLGSLLDEQKKAGVDFSLWLAKWLEAYDRFCALESTLNAYAYAVYSTDTTNTLYLNNISRLEELGLESHALELRFRSCLVENKERLPGFFESFPEHKGYEFLFEELISVSEHQMTEEQEKLALDLQRTGGDAWGRLHEQIISNIKAPDGTTFNELRNLAYSAQPDTRKSAWETEIQLLRQNEIALSAALNNLKGETVTLNKRRSWSSAIDRALFSSRMSRMTLDALIAAIEESLPDWRRYFKAKASLLRKRGLTASLTAGSEAEPGLAFYDLFAPLSADDSQGDGLLSRQWSFGQARDYVLERYYSFSRDMGDFARAAFDKGWIDAEVRPGKVGGAYDQDFAIGHQSRILSNFTGAFSDIITLAHELGHAYHFSCMKGLPVVFFDYPMTLAETASTFAETIVKQDMIGRCQGQERLCVLELELQDAAQVLVDILCRFYFEQSVFEHRRDSELSSADFCELMAQAQERTYGDGLGSERHEYMWAVKSHYYSTGLDFYNFPYAFGQLFAAGLYSLYRQQGPSFAEIYSELLSCTGNMSCEALCKKCGFDITSKAFWLSGISLYKAEIDEFCRLCS